MMNVMASLASQSRLQRQTENFCTGKRLFRLYNCTDCHLLLQGENGGDWEHPSAPAYSKKKQQNALGPLPSYQLLLLLSAEASQKSVDGYAAPDAKMVHFDPPAFVHSASRVLDPA